jgi:hypothetical protein
MVALEATFVPENAGELRASYELRPGEERFFIDLAGGTLAIARDSPRRPDAVIDTDPTTLRALVFGDRKLAGAPVQIRGDARLGRRFSRLSRVLDRFSIGLVRLFLEDRRNIRLTPGSHDMLACFHVRGGQRR